MVAPGFNYGKIWIFLWGEFGVNSFENHQRETHQIKHYIF